MKMFASISIKDSVRSLFKKDKWYIWALVIISILSFWLNFYLIEKTGYGNAYYAAAIRSMTQSFKNFFFVAFDPAGLVSVDKPPLALWVQALFVMVFGYHGWAMLLPQALAATGSSIMMYVLTSKYFGRPAGLISALVMALTPAVVVAARNNTMDSQLVFVLLVAAWFLFKSIEKGKWRYLFWAAVFVGLGFNIKMLQAYMILPAVALVYIFFAKEKLFKRISAGLISIVIMGAVSFAWVEAVALTPAGNRPYVDSSSNNSIWELIMGHNGLERVYGMGRGGAMGGRSGMTGIFGTQGGGNPQQFPGSDQQGNTQQAPNSNFAPPTQNGNNQNNNTANGGAQSSNNQNRVNNTLTSPGVNFGQNSNSQNFITRDGTTQRSDGNTQNSTGGSQTFDGQRGAAGGMGNIPYFGMGNFGAMGGFGGFGGGEIGTAGALRLWQKNMYGQASWLIVFVLFAIAAGIRRYGVKALPVEASSENTEVDKDVTVSAVNKKLFWFSRFGVQNRTLKQGVFVFWIVWLATMFLFFSFAGFYHRYYLCMLAPGIAGLSGIGIVQMYKDFRDKFGWRQWLLPVSLAATSGIAVWYICAYYAALKTTLVPVIAGAAVVSLVLMAINYIKPKKIIRGFAVGLMLVSMLAGPFYWSLTVTLNVPSNVTMPYAGPELASSSRSIGGTPNQEAHNIDTMDKATLTLESYLVSHYKQGSYLVVGRSANDVADFIVDTGLPAVAYGGFMGSDNAITLDKFKQLVSEGKITYVLVSSQGLGGNSGYSLDSYVKANATLIQPSEYGGSSNARGSLYLFK